MARLINKTKKMKQILEILDKYYGGDYNVDCAKEILPLIEKRDEIIQKQDELINITDSFFFDNEDDVNELRQELSKLKGELK